MKDQSEVEAIVIAKKNKLEYFQNLLTIRGTDHFQVNEAIKLLIVELELLKIILNKT